MLTHVDPAPYTEISWVAYLGRSMLHLPRTMYIPLWDYPGGWSGVELSSFSLRAAGLSLLYQGLCELHNQALWRISASKTLSIG